MFINNVFVDLTFKLIMDVHNTVFHKGPVHQKQIEIVIIYSSLCCFKYTVNSFFSSVVHKKRCYDSLATIQFHFIFSIKTIKVMVTEAVIQPNIIFQGINKVMWYMLCKTISF